MIGLCNVKLESQQVVTSTSHMIHVGKFADHRLNYKPNKVIKNEKAGTKK